jgi:hypothetical protein
MKIQDNPLIIRFSFMVPTRLVNFIYNWLNNIANNKGII